MLTLTSATFAFSSSTPSSFDTLLTTFSGWKKTFGKEYASSHEEAQALLFFSELDLRISEHNKLPSSYVMGHNIMSDGLSFTAGLKPGPLRVRNVDPALLNASVYSFASSLDWASRGKVTSIDNQGSCGSCWAFSAAGAIESRRAIAGGPLQKLSKEELINCDMNADGCGGSNRIDEGLRFASTHGLTSESSYPFTSENSPESSGHDGSCKQSKEKSPVVTVGGVHDVPQRDERALLAAVQSGPVSVGIYAAPGSPLQGYSSGVIDHEGCSTQNDHAVLVVGYGHDSSAGLDYWKVKNSWGPGFGESGYFRIVRGKNMCGIAEQAAYPKNVGETVEADETSE